MAQNETIAIGVGAVVFRDNDVLLIQRGKPPFLGAWSIPGGGLEHGEKVIDAVHREVREETDVEIDIIGILDVFDALPRQTDGAFSRHTVIIDYVATWRSGEPVAGDDAAAAIFAPINEAHDLLSWDVTRQALDRAVGIRNSALLRP